jgi:putative ABC transport system substrate-binding protein
VSPFAAGDPNRIAGPSRRSGAPRGARGIALGALAVGLLGCATRGGGGAPRPGAAGDGTGDGAIAVIDPPPLGRAGAPTLLIAMPGSANFAAVRKSLVSEVQRNFNIHTLIVDPRTQVGDLASAIRSIKPDCLVLMNNATMTLYRQYQLANPAASMPPAVLLMASFVEEVQPLIRRATGIAYEVPGVTAFVNLRSVTTTPINRVGVVYRPAFRKFIERQTILARREHVEIVAVSVPNDVGPGGLQEALHDLAKNKKVDAIWMLNDNALVRNVAFLDDAWRAETGDGQLPLIVGVSNFVDPRSPLGTLAVVPDHEALGLQAGNLIYDLRDNGWHVEDHPVELPLSVKTVVDLSLVRNSFGLRPDALEHIDRALE